MNFSYSFILRNYFIPFTIGILILWQCSQKPSSKSKEDKGKILAQVQDILLYQNDLAGIVPPKTPKTDSVEIVERYINSWVRKQLILIKAKTEVKIDEAEIERKVADYRYALLAYAFEKAYIEKNLDTTVNEQEITKYYQENQANFELKQNIVKAVLVKVPLNIPQKDTIKSFIASNDKKDIQKLKEYCVKFASYYTLNDTLWLDFDELIKNTAFVNIPNKVDFLKLNTYSETTDAESKYYLFIREYKISNQISPLSFVRERIKSMVINQRKVLLNRKLEQRVYEEAKKNKTFKIFN